MDDEWEAVACPGCWQPIEPHDLCEHDDGDHGPLCERCCRFHHDGDEAA